MPQARRSNSSNSSNTLLSLSFYLFLLCINLCGIVGIHMFFTTNKRESMISSYNERVGGWEAAGYHYMEETTFSITVDGEKRGFESVETGFGENYPYRDHCSKGGDPQCQSGDVLFYSATIPVGGGNHAIQIGSEEYSGSIFEGVIPFNTSVNLYKKDISCVGGNEQTCMKECTKHHGVWEKDTNTCFVEMYLSKVCFRLAYKNDTSLWSLDMPPLWDLGSGDISFGCQPFVTDNQYHHISSQTWLPFVYSHEIPSNITIEIRHFSDPYISAAYITGGCSSNTVVAQDCFGKSRQEQVFVATILLVIGLIALLIDGGVGFEDMSESGRIIIMK